MIIDINNDKGGSIFVVFVVLECFKEFVVLCEGLVCSIF